MMKRALMVGVESALEALESVPSEEELTETYRAVDESSLAKGFDDLIARDLAEAAAVWRAFASICEDEMGVDAATVIAATFGREFATAHAEEFAEVAAADADAELVERWRGVFAERWGSPA